MFGFLFFAFEQVDLRLQDFDFRQGAVQLIGNVLGAECVIVIQEEIGFFYQQRVVVRMQSQTIFHDLHGCVRFHPDGIPVGQIGQIICVHIDVAAVGLGVLILFRQFRQLSVSS